MEPLENRIKRARNYVAKMPESISGQRGHDTAFKVAQALVRGFSLPIQDALPIWEEYNLRCVPPWSPAESKHKLESALKDSTVKAGYLLDQKEARQTPRKKVTEYRYVTAQNVLQFTKIRFEPKGFTTEFANGVVSNESVRSLLYRLPHVNEAIKRGEKVLLCEGEKDALTAVSFGFNGATTSAWGAESWNDLNASQLKGADVVLVPDTDEAGQIGGFKRARSLLKVAKSVCWLRLPKGKDLTEWVEAGGTKEQLVGLISELEPINEEFVQKLAERYEKKAESNLFGGDDTAENEEEPFPDAISYEDLKPATAEDPLELLCGSKTGKGRVLCKRHVAIMSGETGIGKSSLVTQMAIMFALGQPLFGFVPKRPLKVFMFQTENDERDMWEKIESILENVVKPLNIEGYETTLKQNLLFEKEPCGLRGQNFQDHVRKCGEKYHPDLVIVDPLYAYFGGDVCNQEKVSNWIRDFEKVCQKELFALLLIHHFGKPREDKKEDSVYLASGSSELQNAPRLVINVIRAKGRYFKLRVHKRGGRLGWEDAEGNETDEILIKRALRPAEFWSELDDEDLAELKDAGKRNVANMGRPRKFGTDAYLKILCDLYKENPSGISHHDWESTSMNKLRISKGSFAKARIELVYSQDVAQYDETGFYYPIRRI